MPKQVITIAGQDIPNLKAGALREALSIYSGSDQLMKNVKSYNKSERVFEFRIIHVAADGKLVWSDRVYILQWYCQHQYEF